MASGSRRSSQESGVRSQPRGAPDEQLFEWIEYNDSGYFIRTIRNMHAKRLVEFTEKTDKVRILPPGTKAVQELIRSKNLTVIS